MNDKNVIAGIWEPKIGKSVRLNSFYQNKIHPLIWVSIGKDGSIYVGKPGKKSLLKVGKSIASNGSVTFKYDEGTEISDPSAINKAKISFHASGWVKTNVTKEGLWSFKKTLRNIDKLELLCTVLFQHPSSCEPLETVRKQDIVLNYPFDDKCPLICCIYVAPLGNSAPTLIKDANFQVPVILWYKNLHEISDLEVTLLLYHKTEGPWPPFSYFFWKSKNNDEVPNNTIHTGGQGRGV